MKKIIPLLGLIVLGIIVTLMTHSQTPSQITRVAGTTFMQVFNETPSAVLIDVRTPEEYAEGHIPGAINIDIEGSSFVDSLVTLNKTTPLFVYCRSGNRSGQAVAVMKKLGFTTITELSGGIISNPGLTTETTPHTIVVDTGTDSPASLVVEKGVLTETERSGLLHMREEEKLAHDVYSALFEKWELPVFKNIALSEQTHTLAVKNLLENYGINDPATTLKEGEFSDKEMQTLYDTLTARGSQTLMDALIVGATIEDLDIFDLQKELALTKTPSIQLVYNNLMRGSRNHMRSFVQQIESRGGSYTAQYISAKELTAIVQSPRETGNPNK